MTDRRLIEVAFPLREASLDSVHEKNVRQGHISTLHIWPARRPLAAARATLVATLLEDPESDEERRELQRRLAGVLERVVDRKTQKEKEQTVGGILRWGRESDPDLAWFRERIRKKYGRAPRVLDPFAGGGALPLEAMRLGCEAVAADLNPVAWFVLKCTLEYPQRLAGKTRLLPAFALQDPGWLSEWERAHPAPKKRGRKGAAPSDQGELLADIAATEANLAWHVRAWGRWVHRVASETLSPLYPAYVERRNMKGELVGDPVVVPAGRSPEAHAEAMNREAPGDVPWAPAQTAAYLWARTVPCKRCGVRIPLLKTRWLSKKEGRLRILDIHVDEDAQVSFSVRAVTSKDEDGQGTMSRSGVVCANPSCKAQMRMDDLRLRGKAGELGTVMTAVVYDGAAGKDYRAPRPEELRAAAMAVEAVSGIFTEVPFGLPTEPIAGGEALGMRVPLYGLDRWDKLFTPRQLVALGTFVRTIRASDRAMEKEGYPPEWREAIYAFLCARFDRLLDRCAMLCRPDPSPTQSGVMNVFGRFALPMSWDFIEGNTLTEGSGGWLGDTDWVALVVEHGLEVGDVPAPVVVRQSATTSASSLGTFDVIATDPPYYDAIPYSDLMDFFYVWLRRLLVDSPVQLDGNFAEPLGPKWDAEKRDGELVEDASRFDNDTEAARKAYEDGMYRSFEAMWRALTPEGRLIVVFANKQPDAWGALVAALVRAGFVVTGSWPIQTERQARTRSLGSAALSSSVWLVCRKRPKTARPGFDRTVLEEMRANIQAALARFWKDGIRGPDFVWAATGPALEAYSKYPVVKKADAGGVVDVGEFLGHARRMVVEFVVGRVLSPEGDDATAHELDPVTTYWLLHRQSFREDEVPIGPVILYAVSCGLSDRELIDHLDVLNLKGKASRADEDEDSEDETEDGDGDGGGKGAKVSLKAWDKRKRKGLGEVAIGGRPIPLIDRIHKTMQLWAKGDVGEVDRYLDANGLRHGRLFRKVLQATIELSAAGSQERSLLEAISNHIGVEHDGPPQLQLNLTPRTADRTE